MVTDYDEIQMRANIDKAKIKGINVTFNSYLGAGFTLNGGYSFMDGKNVYEDEPLDKTVKHSGTVAAMWSHTWNKYKLNVNFNGRIQGERYLLLMDTHRNIPCGISIRAIRLEPAISCWNRE